MRNTVFGNITLFRLLPFSTLAALALVTALVAPLQAFSQSASTPAFIGTKACAACHEQAFGQWQQSDHRHAMEVADSTSVLGNFKDASFDYFGTSSRFFTREGKYFVETDNASGELQTFPVAYTFGYYPLQQYLIEFPDGRLQALSISWDSRPTAEGGQRWFHLYPDQKISHNDVLHWTGAFQNWNSRCAACHSTDIVKHYTQATDQYATQWQELNVGCEACHGAGANHLAWANGDIAQDNKGLLTHLAKTWEPVNGSLPIAEQVNSTLNSTMSGQLQACAGCHARRSELRHPDVSADFFDNYTLSPLLEERYFADGQILEEVYVTGSFLQSKMHQNQVSCTNCHEPHSGQLRVAGNGLCLQCHDAGKFQSKQHFFHESNSTGAQCVNCHMPQRTYMGVDARRDHSIRIPDPIASITFGVPNACTQCHTDKSDQWAADFISTRTGRTEPWYQHSTLLTAARKNDVAVVPELISYALDNAKPPILRSIALLESGRFPSAAQLESVSLALASSNALIRLGAVAALGNQDAGQRWSYLQALLTDPAKSVRMAVASTLIDIPVSQIPLLQRSALEKLFEEYRQGLLYNADMPESMSNLALFQAAQGNLDAAEKSLLQARQLSPRYLPALLNLADLYRARDHDDLGEALLHEALSDYPESGDVRHLLGLLYVRTGRTSESVALFDQASQLAPDNAQYALVYGVALMETGRRSDAIRVLQTARQRFPGDISIQQALTSYQAQ